jgi:Spo0E like sporulation regulatory protein
MGKIEEDIQMLRTLLYKLGQNEENYASGDLLIISQTLDKTLLKYQRYFLDKEQ